MPGLFISTHNLNSHILEAMSNTVPLAQLMDGQIAALRHWAKGRARQAANHTAGLPRHTRRMAEAN